MSKFIHHRYYPWLVIAMCAAFLFYKYILQVSPSIMTGSLMENFHVKAAGLGNLAATFFYSYIIMQLFVGFLLDRYNPRLLTSLALVVCALGALFFSLSTNILAAGLSRALMGVGVAFATVAYLKMTSMWFRPDQYAFVSGLLASAAMLGALFGQAPLSFVVKAVGWRHTLFLCAMLGLILAVLFYALVRNRYTDLSQHHDNTITLKGFLSVLTSKKNWLLTLYGGLAFEPLIVFGGLWGNPYIEQAYSVSGTQAASIVSLSFVGVMVGSPLLGLISDKLGKRLPVMFVGTLLSLICLTLAIYVFLPQWLLGILLFFFGVGVSAFMLVFSVGRDVNPLFLAATVAAMINTGDAILGAFTEPMIGKLLDMQWSGAVDANGVHVFSVHHYHMAMLCLPLYSLLAFVVLWLFKRIV